MLYWAPPAGAAAGALAAAGAGVAAHLHQHIVPRWQSDANFFPIIARTKSMSQMLGETRRLVADGWPWAH